jgi:hypothetical protein
VKVIYARFRSRRDRLDRLRHCSRTGAPWTPGPRPGAVGNFREKTCRTRRNVYALALEHAPSRSSYIGAAIEGFAVGRIARAFARRFGTLRQKPEIISPVAIEAELGGWARGYALDQQLSGAKARRELGWTPHHLDPEREIAAA